MHIIRIRDILLLNNNCIGRDKYKLFNLNVYMIEYI